MGLVEILLGPFKWLLVKYLRFIIIFDVLVKITLRIINCPVMRIILLKCWNYLHSLLQHLQCSFLIFHHHQKLCIHTITFGIDWMVEAKLFFPQLNRLLKILIETINVPLKYFSAPAGLQQVCQQRMRILKSDFSNDDWIDLFNVFKGQIMILLFVVNVHMNQLNCQVSVRILKYAPVSLQLVLI